MKPEYGNNFLLAFDYKLPPLSKPVNRILFIHSSRTDQSFLSFRRIAQLYPDAEFFILKGNGVEFPHYDLKNVKEITFDDDRLPPDFHQSGNGQFLKSANIDLVFFCANYDIRLPSPDDAIKLNYNNILRFVDTIGLYDWTCIVDNQFCIYYPHQIEITRTEKSWKIGGYNLELPHTMLSLEEKQTLFELAANGASCGVIVNIGVYLGGSSIILAKASKSKNREKVHSFDLKINEKSQDFYSKNNVADWIIPQESDSVEAAKIWLDQGSNPIRLLLIDGDHSFEGAKNDIVHWTKSLAPGGVIAVHDYGNVSAGTKYSEVVQAVYETILSCDEFHDFKRVDTLFFARKK
ncbi:MAG: class I SAM-dependent methyltransferase [Nitrospinae bacterium]|nr:class I SAM-dependent methyltransferase [Nitrospinota bacterium]MBL7020624.1 class I SAM-dependent methyltransferase [Nitrospinaceae bacterium]